MYRELSKAIVVTLCLLPAVWGGAAEATLIEVPNGVDFRNDTFKPMNVPGSGDELRFGSVETLFFNLSQDLRFTFDKNRRLTIANGRPGAFHLDGRHADYSINLDLGRPTDVDFDRRGDDPLRLEYGARTNRYGNTLQVFGDRIDRPIQLGNNQRYDHFWFISTGTPWFISWDPHLQKYYLQMYAKITTLDGIVGRNNQPHLHQFAAGRVYLMRVGTTRPPRPPGGGGGTPIPEPMTMTLLAAGLIGGAIRRKTSTES